MSKLLVIGCGAIAQGLYLPWIGKDRELLESTVLVDTNPDLLSEVASSFGIRQTSSKFEEHLRQASVALVLTPPKSHYPIGRQLIENGIHVLLEKPLCDLYEEGKALVDLAAKRDVELCVNNVRRLFPINRKIKSLTESGELGALKSVKYHEGGPFNWPSSSGFYFNPKLNKRGVFSDRGSHVVDLISWWSNQELRLVDCQSDAIDGIEGLAFAEFAGVDSEFTAEVRLSWYNKLKNKYQLVFENGVVEGSIYDVAWAKISQGGREKKLTGVGSQKKFDDFGRTLVEGIKELRSGNSAEELPTGKDVLPSISLIDEFYSSVKPMKFQWY